MRFFLLLCYCLLSIFSLAASWPVSEERRLKGLYNRLDPTSVTQHLAFYRLYGDSPFGVRALHDAIELLAPGEEVEGFEADLGQVVDVESIVALVNPAPDVEAPLLNERQIACVERLARRLPHNKLKGHSVTSEAQALQLEPDEVDLSRALFVALMGSEPAAMQKIKSYEARLDLMALQILARTSLTASPQEKIRAINTFVFEEVGFKFPPHSLHAEACRQGYRARRGGSIAAP